MISPRLIAIGVSAAVLFAAGWNVNGWRLNAKIAKAEVAAAAVYEARRVELLAEYEAQAGRDQTARVALSRDLDSARTKTSILLEELETARLTPVNPTIERILIPGDCDAGQPTVVLANPFTDDFVRLWNDSTTDSRPADP